MQGIFTNEPGSSPIPQFMRTIFKGYSTESNGSTKPDFNILDWRCPVPLGGVTAADIVAQMTTYIAGLKAAKPTTWNLAGVEVQFLDNPTNPKVLVTTVAGAGSVITDRAASFNAVVIRKLSGMTGRNYMGSIHYGAVPESFTELDHVNATGITVYTVMLDELNAWAASGLDDGTNLWYPIIISSDNSDLASNPCVITGAYANSFTLNAKIGTMKRRKEKTGS